MNILLPHEYEYNNYLQQIAISPCESDMEKNYSKNFSPCESDKERKKKNLWYLSF